MGRPHIEFIQARDVDSEVAEEGPFAGVRQRLLSRDDETGASTAVVSLDAGWSSEIAGEAVRVELFVLAGTAVLDSRELSSGSYAYVPAAAPGGRLRATSQVHALAMVEPAADSGDVAAIDVIDTTAMRWAASSFASVPAGLVNKRLRDDPETGERTWLAACAPGWVEDRAEVHPTVEESMTLRGDILLGTRGVMTPGCYFWRPPMVPHGPMYSRTGAEFFFRTKGGTLEVTYESVPGWEELVRGYRESEPLYGIIES